MNSRLSPAKLFYPVALILFSGMFLFPSPLMPTVVFYALLVGAIWTYIPKEMQIDNPTMSEMGPPLFMLVFMGVLTQIQNKPTTESLFHTVRGLIMFRTLVFILIKVRFSPNPISRQMIILLCGILLEMIFVGIRVYHLIYPLDVVPSFLQYVEIKVLALITAGLMLHAYLQKSRR